LTDLKEPAPEELQQSLGALEGNAWNISRAARHLGITRHGLKKRMRRLGIRRPAGLGDPEPEIDD
jgi:transcriptional regulator of acetoin/glycerol metabolism